jgi:hypothetical protein
MAARFTKGTNMRSTSHLEQARKVAPVQKNSMKGLPGHIKTGQDTSSGGLASTKPVGPRFNMGTSLETTRRTVALRSQGAYIGKKGGQSVGSHFKAATSRGSADKSYRATSTGPAGKITGGKMEGLRGRAKFSTER